jgi:hypothetical protein
MKDSACIVFLRKQPTLEYKILSNSSEVNEIHESEDKNLNFSKENQGRKKPIARTLEWIVMWDFAQMAWDIVMYKNKTNDI